MSGPTRPPGRGRRRLRTVLGASLIGGMIAALTGSTFTAAVVLLEFGMPFSRELPGVLMGMLGELAGVLFLYGALTTGGFAALLAMTGRTLPRGKLRAARTTRSDAPSRMEG